MPHPLAVGMNESESKTTLSLSRSDSASMPRCLRRGRLLAFLISATNIAAQTTAQTKDWSDKSPHKSGFATAGGIELHYLDWGGKGEPLLF